MPKYLVISKPQTCSEVNLIKRPLRALMPIENTQVINIIDSVVERATFNMGEYVNSPVNIRDSVVKRSKIGNE